MTNLIFEVDPNAPSLVRTYMHLVARWVQPEGGRTKPNLIITFEKDQPHGQVLYLVG